MDNDDEMNTIRAKTSLLFLGDELKFLIEEINEKLEGISIDGMRALIPFLDKIRNAEIGETFTFTVPEPE